MEAVLNQITPLLRELLTISPLGGAAVETYLNESVKNGVSPEDALGLEFQHLRQELLKKMMMAVKVDQEQYERAVLYLHFALRLDFPTLEQVLELSHGEYTQILFSSLEKLGIETKFFSYRNANVLTPPSWWPLVQENDNRDQADNLSLQVLGKLKFVQAKTKEITDLKLYLNKKFFTKLTVYQKIHRALLGPDEAR